MNAKDAYWFSHDSNAKDDPKIMLLIDQLGLEGYGIFWVLVETLRDQPGYRYPIKLLAPLAKKFLTSAEKMLTVVRSYELFTIEEDEFFFSESLNRRMSFLDKKREQARIAGRKSGEARRLKSATSNDRSTEVQQTLNERRTSKVNIIKENKSNKSFFTPPSFDEVKDYCEKRGRGVDPEKWINHYQAKGWLIGKNKMKDWRAAVRTWESNNYGRNGHDTPMKQPPGQQIKEIQIQKKKL